MLVYKQALKSVEKSDVYKTISVPSKEAVFKEKGSKFLAYAYPLSNQDEVEELLQMQKKAHNKARHWCYAWQTGLENPVYRYHDDGEPNNSAGKPIYGQIQSFELTNVLIVVVRYFGGTKLGVGGLVNAYKTAAKLACENAKIVKRTLKEKLSLQFEYADMDKVMRIIKENKLVILEQKMDVDCRIQISVRKNDADRVRKLFENLRCITIKKIN